MSLVYNTQNGFTILRVPNISKKCKYVHENGKIVSSEENKRIRRLGLPPAWTQVKVASNPWSHIQAFGYDQKGETISLSFRMES